MLAPDSPRYVARRQAPCRGPTLSGAARGLLPPGGHHLLRCTRDLGSDADRALHRGTTTARLPHRRQSRTTCYPIVPAVLAPQTTLPKRWGRPNYWTVFSTRGKRSYPIVISV
jgi:hypothetical protein